MDVKIGETALAFFKATNKAKTPVTGRAIFNVSPENAGLYFTKIQCFCFTKQTLAAGASVEMPVTFFVNPRIVEDEQNKDISEITLSYTFTATTEILASRPAGRRQVWIVKLKRERCRVENEPPKCTVRVASGVCWLSSITGHS